MTPLDEADLARLRASAQEAIRRACQRVDRAEAARDVEAVIGASKELVETVGKSIVDALGGSYGSDIDMPKLGKQVLERLGLHPDGLQDRNSLRKFSSAIITIVNALAELRNSDGTGHGRAEPSDLDESHARLAKDLGESWARWALAAASRVLEGRAAVEQAVDMLEMQVFHRNELPRFLSDQRLTELAEDDQRKLGLAVGRRWNVGGTFLAYEDVIQPLALGQEDYPPAFAEGLLEGLLLDQNGFLRTTQQNIESLVQIGRRLPAPRAEEVFEELADRAEDAQLSYALGDPELDSATAHLRSLANSHAVSPLGLVLDRIATRFEDLQQQRNWDHLAAAEAEDEDDY